MLSKLKSIITYHKLKNSNLPAKEFYKKYIPSITYTPLKKILFQNLKEYSSVFEFGCHDGFNLAELRKMYPEMIVMGIDLNKHSIKQGLRKNRNYIFQGDENTLKYFKNFDVVFTSSVLCHNENISKILIEITRMKPKKIILLETNETKGPYYFPHDYQTLGFKKLHSIKNPRLNGNGAIYDYWEYTLEV